jgi:hypothetical protein
MSEAQNTAITTLRERKNALMKAVQSNIKLLETLPEDKQGEFKSNFMELATNDYLMGLVAPKELFKFALDVTKMGININPIAGECYIIPFDTKINGTKVMIPQAVLPDNGLKQIAYRAGMFLSIDPVFNINGKIKAESELTREEQASIDTSNSEWVENSLVGYDIKLNDLRGELPEQTKFVDINYCKSVTKTLKDERFKIQTWKHKACRRAYKEFFIPSQRKDLSLEKVDKINIDYETGDAIDVQEVSKENTQEKPKKMAKSLY